MLIESLESREMFAVTPLQSVAEPPSTAAGNTEIQGVVWTGVYDRASGGATAGGTFVSGHVWSGVYDR